jgi:2-polyprenyl-3-methyl-5-hydroxy-6-metoxy-1,4-benzoquinol methylase
MSSKQRQIERWNNLKQPSLTNLKCVICEYEDLNEKFTKIYANDIFNAGVIIRHKCPNCDLIFGDLRFLNLSDEEIQNDHDDTYTYFKEGDNIIYQLNSLNSIQIFKDKNLSYLDWACGIGKMIPILKDKGYNITGYDKYVKNQNVLNNIDGKQFDVIYSNNFIEHLINPVEQIKLMLEYLKCDGYLIFISDCIDEYKVEFTHFHTYYYIGRSFQLLCDKLNLNIIESKTIDICKIKVLQKKQYKCL